MSSNNKKILNFLKDLENSFGPTPIPRKLLLVLLATRIIDDCIPDKQQSFEGIFSAIEKIKSYQEFILQLKNYDEYFATSFFTSKLDQLDLASKEITIFLHAFKELHYQYNKTLLGYVYENFATTKNLKKEGLFYTPEEVVEKMLEFALTPLLKGKDLSEAMQIKILDPACGSGIFLIKALEHLVKHFDNTESNYELHTALLNNCIFGVDLDSDAVELTKLSLILSLYNPKQISLFSKTAAPNLKENIQSGNSLLDVADFNSSEAKLAQDLKAFAWQDSFSEIFLAGGFDCIIGNPPYGLSRNEQLSPKENEKLKAVYNKYRHGKINKYLSFMAKAHQLVKDTGRISLIVPNAWLGIQSGKPLRKLFLSEQCLENIVVYQDAVFEDPSVEVVSFTINKEKKHKNINVFHAKNGKLKENNVLPVKHCIASPDYLIPTTWSKEVFELIKFISKTGKALDSMDSPFRAHIALQAYATGKGLPPQSKDDVKNHIYHATEKINESYHPYLEGSDVQRYTCKWSGAYLHYGKHLAEPQKLKRFSGPRVLVREIISPSPYLLSAAYTDKISLYNKSVLHIIFKSDAERELMLALVAIFNSKLGSFQIKYQGRKSQRKIFPKIVNDDLKSFILPEDFKDYKSLAAYVEEMQKLIAEKGHEDNSIKALQDKIDQEVYKTYQLETNNILSLEKSLVY